MPLGSHTVTIVRPVGQDRHGDPLPGDPSETQVSGCSVQPSSTTELTDGRDTVVSLWDLFLPAGTDIRATDRVRFNGELFDVDGDPAPWDDDLARAHHIEVRLRRVTG